MRLSANPHFYDYLRSITLREDHTCEFVDGAGQCLNLEVEGTYEMLPNSIRFEVEGKKFEVPYHIQEGTFVLRQEVVWRVKSEEEYPVLVATQRYVFSEDPFKGLDIDLREDNLYYLLEGSKETPDNLRHYYLRSSIQHKLVKDLSLEEREILTKSEKKED